MDKIKLTVTTKDGIIISAPIELSVSKYSYLSSDDFKVIVENIKEQQESK